jgi:hypothetical protein
MNLSGRALSLKGSNHRPAQTFSSKHIYQGGKKLVLEFLLRFITGGVAVSALAVLGDILRPKSFAGLFGAAPSIAIATIMITLWQKGALFVAVQQNDVQGQTRTHAPQQKSFRSVGGGGEQLPAFSI